MFVNLVKKHGLVPQAFMPETESSSNSAKMNGILTHKLREGAKTLRDMAAKGASLDELLDAKDELVGTVYRILSIHLGTPPTDFDWQWNDADRKFQSDGALTPKEFAEKYITVPIDDYVCLVHDPSSNKPGRKDFYRRMPWQRRRRSDRKIPQRGYRLDEASCNENHHRW